MNNISYSIDSALATSLQDLGLSPADVLRRAGLADDLLRQATARLAPLDYHNLWQGIAAEAGDALFPIRFCQTLRAESFSPPLFAALCSPNLAVAAERLARYKAISAPMEISVHHDGAQMAIEVRWHDAAPKPPLSLVMTELLSFVALARIGTREQIVPVEVCTTELPDPVPAYEAYLGGPLRLAARHRIIFTAATATQPFLTSCDTLWHAFEPELRQRLADLDGSVTMTQRVRAVLLESLPAGLATMETVASKLAISKRTLQRRMLDEGSSYQVILNETRAALAQHYLCQTSLPASKISFLLGFDEPNSFYRAFKGWTGKTPDTVRHPQGTHP